MSGDFAHWLRGVPNEARLAFDIVFADVEWWRTKIDQGKEISKP